MKSTLNNYRQSPRKVRLVANAIKGKRVAQADAVLSFMPKRAAEPIQKLVRSAVANAKAQGVSEENLVVKNVEVNKGTVMKRWMPRAQGRATPINKRSSHVDVTLVEVAPKIKAAPRKKPEAKN
ncbi:MAG TPA: 50S ribosomal protein L22 [Candidatus Paceibacterota bacterium]|jgi:large subunit ribosomal protein L22|nr:50S ribosomal protein L22 [Candidatus Paceibacterota bacterium]